MPQLYKKKQLRNVKDLPKKSFLLAAKECDKGQSIEKAALFFNLDKITLYQYLNKKIWEAECAFGYGAVSQA